MQLENLTKTVVKNKKIDMVTELYILITENIRKKVLTKAIWVDKKWGLVSGRIAWNIRQNRNLDFNSEFSS